MDRTPSLSPYEVHKSVERALFNRMDRCLLEGRLRANAGPANKARRADLREEAARCMELAARIHGISPEVVADMLGIGR